MKTFLVLALAASFFSACGKKTIEKQTVTVVTEREQSAPPLETKIVLGNPESLVAGANFNRQLPFTKDNLAQYEHFQLRSVVTYRQKIIEAPEMTLEEAQVVNAPAENEYDMTLDKDYLFAGNGRTYYYSKCPGWILKFLLTPGREHLTLIKISHEGEPTPVELLHYSERKDAQGAVIAFTILVKGENDIDGKFLKTLLFIRKQDQRTGPDNVDSAWPFIFGAGVRYHWPQKMVIHPCAADLQGTVQSEEVNLVRDAVEIWNEGLKKSGRTLEMGAVKTGMVFSDLNQNCIFFHPFFRRDENSSAVTMVWSDFYTRQNLAAYIHVYYENTKEDRTKHTILHELGHFIGLDHQFDGRPSIMSYGDEREYRLTEYDEQALEKLYPLIR